MTRLSCHRFRSNHVRLALSLLASSGAPAETALESSHIAIRKDAEAVLRLMNSTGRLVVDRLLCSTAAMTLCSSVSNSSALILDFSSSVKASSTIVKASSTIWLRTISSA